MEIYSDTSPGLNKAGRFEVVLMKLRSQQNDSHFSFCYLTVINFFLQCFNRTPEARLSCLISRNMQGWAWFLDERISRNSRTRLGSKKKKSLANHFSTVVKKIIWRWLFGQKESSLAQGTLQLLTLSRQIKEQGQQYIVRQRRNYRNI